MVVYVTTAVQSGRLAAVTCHTDTVGLSGDGLAAIVTTC